MSVAPSHKVVMVGREEEHDRLDRLLFGARSGESAVLVLCGAAGTGKTALLEYAADGAEGFLVVRAAGDEAEMELPFAGLHQLCAALLDRLDRLPDPQAAALRTAFGLSAGLQPDRFLIGLATLTLLSEAAEELPVLCLVDDAQWLDQSSALVLAFVARRLRGEGVVLLFAVREAPEADQLRSLPMLRLAGLSDADARTLLASVIGAPLDERVRARILAEARGNPLALRELPHELPSMGSANGFRPPADLGLQSRIEAGFRRRVQELPAESRRLLLLAAAEPTGAPALLWQSAAELNIATDAIGPAVGDGILELGTRITFRHPLMRSVSYGSATAEDRRAAHRALAAVTSAELDPDRRAWHLARAALAPDEAIADELERSADRAQARGGLPAAAAFLERAAALSVDPGKRARRALAAAEAKQLAGSPGEALSLLASAADGALGDSDRAKLQRLHGQIALDLRRAGDAVPLLLDAARRLESLDRRLMRETYLEAFRAASVAGRLGGGVIAVAKATRSAPGTPGPKHATDVLLDGLAVRFTSGYVASAPALTQALAAIRDVGARHGPLDVRWPWVARRVAPDLFDDDTWDVFATRNVQTAREAGALAVLPLALNYLSLLRCFEGQLAAAEALLDEADEIADATETAEMVFGRILLAGCRGDEQRSLAVIEAGETAAIARNEGVVLTFGEHARALLYNGLGQPAAAVAPAESACLRDELMVSVWSLPELVEAAVRSGDVELAADAMERLAERTMASGTNLAHGIRARAAALVSDGETAEEHHREAIARLGRSRMALDLARAHLLYGEWLRRQQRRVDARKQLRAAHEMFASMGAAAFGERARRELLATGETVGPRTPQAAARLTAQEAQIAQMASGGLSNPEIGARLFISPRTVQYHLRKVFVKLNISSRNQLQQALRPEAAVPGVRTPGWPAGAASGP